MFTYTTNRHDTLNYFRMNDAFKTVVNCCLLCEFFINFPSTAKHIILFVLKACKVTIFISSGRETKSCFFFEKGTLSVWQLKSN